MMSPPCDQQRLNAWSIVYGDEIAVVFCVEEAKNEFNRQIARRAR